jgi:hypothetical protein
MYLTYVTAIVAALRLIQPALALPSAIVTGLDNGDDFDISDVQESGADDIADHDAWEADMMEWEEELEAWGDDMSSVEGSDTPQNEVDGGTSLLGARDVFGPFSSTCRKSLT